jgi:transcriptional regulator with XRE-family HTH domain
METAVMLSETLATGLEQYRIGPKIRALRLKKKLGLVQLGQHTGLSPAMLSKIERGQLFPTLPTLLRIALVFGVSLEHFFAQDEGRPLVSVIRKADRLRLPDKAGKEPPAFLFESLDFSVTDRKIEAYLAQFPEGSPSSEPHKHEGAELIYVMDGALTVSIEDEDFALDQGDAMYFEAGASHSYRRSGKQACTAIVVVAPK